MNFGALKKNNKNKHKNNTAFFNMPAQHTTLVTP